MIGGWLRENWLAVVAAWLIAGMVVASFRHPSPKAGDECGPKAHWVYVGTPMNDDLSCEPDPK